MKLLVVLWTLLCDLLMLGACIAVFLVVKPVLLAVVMVAAMAYIWLSKHPSPFVTWQPSNLKNYWTQAQGTFDLWKGSSSGT